MNFQRYLYGIKAWFLRKITKNRVGIVSLGNIPRCYVNWTGIMIKEKRTVYRKMDEGVKGKIIITSLPQTTDSENTEEMRQLWVGCEIKGFLWSLYKFMAIDMQECWLALRKNNLDNIDAVENLITFWEERVCSLTDTFLFVNCFKFKKKCFKHNKTTGFGSSLSGHIINFRSR